MLTFFNNEQTRKNKNNQAYKHTHETVIPTDWLDIHKCFSFVWSCKSVCWYVYLFNFTVRHTVLEPQHITRKKLTILYIPCGIDLIKLIMFHAVQKKWRNSRPRNLNIARKDREKTNRTSTNERIDVKKKREKTPTTTTTTNNNRETKHNRHSTFQAF